MKITNNNNSPEQGSKRLTFIKTFKKHMINPQSVLTELKYQSDKSIKVVKFHEAYGELHITVNRSKKVAEKALQEAYGDNYSTVNVYLG